MSQGTQPPGPYPNESAQPALPAAASSPATLASRVGLSDQQFERLIAALERRRDLVTSLHDLTPDQKRAVEAFERAATLMAVPGFGALPPPVIRKDGVIATPVPKNAVKARVFLESGVVDISVEGGSPRFRLPDSISADDRVGRVEFYNSKGRLLAATGGEVVEPDLYERGRITAGTE